MWHKKLSALACLTSALLALTSCTNESYDSGDGGLSYLCAEFVEIHTSHDTIMRSATTDAGSELIFSQPIRSSWASVPDSSYRALLYYDKATSPVSVFSLQRVLVLSPVPLPSAFLSAPVPSASLSAPVPSAFPEGSIDPLSVESVWTSESGKYFNLSLLLKTGNADGNTSQQWLSLVVDPEGSSDGDLLLLHRQNGVPEYYTSRAYVSIPVSSLPVDVPINIRIHTYKGEKIYRLR